jgi:protein-S-isoprenylcysteine O-methyltransferase Ste14
LGVSALVSGVMRPATAAQADFWTPAILGVAAINALVGVLFLTRRPVVRLGSLWQLAACLPSMVGYGLTLQLAPAPGEWPWPTHALFAVGVCVTLAAFLTLGRSFGILPALRQTVMRGPYRVVRHPAYSGELLMALACSLAQPTLMATLPWLLLLPGVVWRILAEERLLAEDPAYANYVGQVRWRLVPCVW